MKTTKQEFEMLEKKLNGIWAICPVCETKILISVDVCPKCKVEFTRDKLFNDKRRIPLSQYLKEHDLYPENDLKYESDPIYEKRMIGSDFWLEVFIDKNGKYVSVLDSNNRIVLLGNDDTLARLRFY
jgi:hypothetical protein